MNLKDGHITYSKCKIFQHFMATDVSWSSPMYGLTQKYFNTLQNLYRRSGIFRRKIFRGLNFRLALFSSLWPLDNINLLHLYVKENI